MTTKAWRNGLGSKASFQPGFGMAGHHISCQRGRGRKEEVAEGLTSTSCWRWVDSPSSTSVCHEHEGGEQSKLNRRCATSYGGPRALAARPLPCSITWRCNPPPLGNSWAILRSPSKGDRDDHPFGLSLAWAVPGGPTQVRFYRYLQAPSHK